MNLDSKVPPGPLADKWDQHRFSGKLVGVDEVVIWGTGTPRREFLHVDDLADACLFLLERYKGPEHINVGTGQDLSILELAEMARAIVHPSSRLVFDSTKPDGTPRKLLDVGRLHGLGWRHRIELREGIAATYHWFVGSEEVATSSRIGHPPLARAAKDERLSFPGAESVL